MDILIVDQDGTVRGRIEQVETYDLDKPLAKVDLIMRIQVILDRV